MVQRCCKLSPRQVVELPEEGSTEKSTKESITSIVGLVQQPSDHSLPPFDHSLPPLDHSLPPLVPSPPPLVRSSPPLASLHPPLVHSYADNGVECGAPRGVIRH